MIKGTLSIEFASWAWNVLAHCIIYANLNVNYGNFRHFSAYYVDFAFQSIESIDDFEISFLYM